MSISEEEELHKLSMPMALSVLSRLLVGKPAGATPGPLGNIYARSVSSTPVVPFALDSLFPPDTHYFVWPQGMPDGHRDPNLCLWHVVDKGEPSQKETLETRLERAQKGR